MKPHFIILLLSTFLTSCVNGVDEKLKYLQQKPPSLIPKVFAPEIISKEDEYEFGSVFNKEGTEFYYGVNVEGKSEIRYSQLDGNKWSDPKPILTHKKYGFNDPFLSPDEKRLYFISERAIDDLGTKQDYDIWYVEKEGNEWSEPINAGPNINSNRNEYYISFTQTGTMYFSSNKITSVKRQNDFDIYSSKNINGEFQKAIRLGDSINTSNYQADVFTDPEETYIIFVQDARRGLAEVTFTLVLRILMVHEPNL